MATTTTTDWFVLDLETTGLSPEDGDLICEVGLTAITEWLEPVAEIELILTGDGQIDRLVQDDFVYEMHLASGLYFTMEENAKRGWKLSHSDCDKNLAAFIEKYKTPESKVLLIGSSIHFDRGFIKKYLPLVEAQLHYRMIDVSTIKELARKWAPGLADTLPKPTRMHRALSDISDTLSELNGYMELFTVWNTLPKKTDLFPPEVLLGTSSPDCSICGKEIQVAIFKGTGVCSVICKKQRDGDPRVKSY